MKNVGGFELFERGDLVNLSSNSAGYSAHFFGKKLTVGVVISDNKPTRFFAVSNKFAFEQMFCEITNDLNAINTLVAEAQLQYLLCDMPAIV